MNSGIFSPCWPLMARGGREGGPDAFNVSVGNTNAGHCFLQITVLDVNKAEKASSWADS